MGSDSERAVSAPLLSVSVTVRAEREGPVRLQASAGTLLESQSLLERCSASEVLLQLTASRGTASVTWLLEEVSATQLQFR